MNDLLFAQELAAVLASDTYADFRDSMRPEEGADPFIVAAQGAQPGGRPLLTVSGQYDNYGIRRKGLVTLELLGRIHAETTEDQEHQARFDLLWDALLGAQGPTNAATASNRATAKVLLQTALATRGKVTLIAFGPAPQNTITADVTNEDLRTTLQLSVVWQFTPPV